MLPETRFLPRLATALILALVLGGCASTAPTSPAGQDRPPATGYLHAQAIPDSLTLVPPPPAPGSAAAALDAAVATQALALRDSARFTQAHVDADLSFPVGADQFSCALGIPINTTHTPALYRLLERSRIDASAATRAAKNHYRRPRPFVLNQQPVCTPEEEARLRDSGSYPSGHTAIGWAWALILAEIAPERATPLLQRGHNYGHSRLVCNVHWYSDVQQGRAMAAATVARLHDDAQFSVDLKLARREINATRALALPMPRDCTAEATALATELSEAP